MIPHCHGNLERCHGTLEREGGTIFCYCEFVYQFKILKFIGLLSGCFANKLCNYRVNVDRQGSGVDYMIPVDFHTGMTFTPVRDITYKHPPPLNYVALNYYSLLSNYLTFFLVRQPTIHIRFYSDLENVFLIFKQGFQTRFSRLLTTFFFFSCPPSFSQKANKV